MSDENEGSFDDLRARGHALQARGLELQAEGQALQAELNALFDIPEDGPIDAVFDDDGLLIDLTAKPAAADLDGEELIREVNLAVMRKAGMLPAVLGARPGATDPGSILQFLAQTPDAPPSTEPQPVSNAQRTVTVTAMSGTIVGIEADEAWAESSSVSAVLRDIVATAQEAARTTDTNGRFGGDGRS